jgi:hypothetical protein
MDHSPLQHLIDARELLPFHFILQRRSQTCKSQLDKIPFLNGYPVTFVPRVPEPSHVIEDRFVILLLNGYQVRQPKILLAVIEIFMEFLLQPLLRVYRVWR